MWRVSKTISNIVVECDHDVVRLMFLKLTNEMRGEGGLSMLSMSGVGYSEWEFNQVLKADDNVLFKIVGLGLQTGKFEVNDWLVNELLWKFWKTILGVQKGLIQVNAMLNEWCYGVFYATVIADCDLMGGKFWIKQDGIFHAAIGVVCLATQHGIFGLDELNGIQCLADGSLLRSANLEGIIFDSHGVIWPTFGENGLDLFVGLMGSSCRSEFDLLLLVSNRVSFLLEGEVEATNWKFKDLILNDHLIFLSLGNGYCA